MFLIEMRSGNTFSDGDGQEILGFAYMCFTKCYRCTLNDNDVVP
uniref:Uncharacterized protein n=1 Tax=Arundo donax TaxID=35708 RepID=A0A0A9GY34_ARUDO